MESALVDVFQTTLDLVDRQYILSGGYKPWFRVGKHVNLDGNNKVNDLKIVALVVHNDGTISDTLACFGEKFLEIHKLLQQDVRAAYEKEPNIAALIELMNTRGGDAKLSDCVEFQNGVCPLRPKNIDPSIFKNNK